MRLRQRKVIHHVHRVLSEGRFFVMNIAPVLIRRASRGEASKRITVPFDVHQLFIREGFDFMEDIIREKPEGAGWATGRGRRFAADRHPATFPLEMAEKVIQYYSFKKDVVLDPFAGIGTVGKAATRLGPRFVLIEQDSNYVDIMRDEAKTWMGPEARHIFYYKLPTRFS